MVEETGKLKILVTDALISCGLQWEKTELKFSGFI